MHKLHKITLILAILLLASPVFSAEILIRAQDHWTETADTTGWSQEQLDEKHRATIKGCPILIEPDGWEWGNREGPPEYIRVNLVWADTTRPEITPAQIKHYMSGLQDSTKKILKRRKYRIPAALVDSVMNHYGGIVTLTPAKLLNVIKEFKQDGSGWD